MDGLLNLLNLYAKEDQHELELSQHLQVFQNHQSFASRSDDSNITEINDAVSIINTKLNNADSRIEGALLLDSLIPQCGTNVFTENCISWMQQSMKMLQGPQKMEQGVTACVVIGKLVAFSSQFPDATRQLSTTMISQLVTMLCDQEFKEKHQLMEQSLECLKTCMKYFNSPCGQAKNTIERHLLSLVDSENMLLNTSIHVSWTTCMALLPSLGGSGTQGMQYKTNWVEFCFQLINSVHNSINGLFKNITEIKTYEAQPNTLKLEKLKHKIPMVLLHAERRRFVNLCSVLSHLLKDPYPTSKNIPVDNFLEIISRVMLLNSKTLSKGGPANFEKLTLGSIIPDLHSAMLDILTALIGSCKSQLMTRANVIMNLFVQVLQWTMTPFNQRSYASERPYGKLRSQAYKGLCYWLAASRSACGLSKHQDMLFRQLISDIVTHRDTVQLQTTFHSLPTAAPVGKKGKKKLLNSTGVIQRKLDLRANSGVCHLALKCLSTILLYCGSRIKPALHKEIQEIVLAVLVEIKNGAQLNTMLPYNDPRCRASLYKVLENLVLCPSPQWPAPIHYASVIFKNGLNDSNLDVSLICTEALVAIQSLLRPRGPTLNFQLDPKKMNFIHQEKSLLGEMINNNSESTDSTIESVLQKRSQIHDSLNKQFEIRQPEKSPMPNDFPKLAQAVLNDPPKENSEPTEIQKPPEIAEQPVEDPALPKPADSVVQSDPVAPSDPVEEPSNGHSTLDQLQKEESSKIEEMETELVVGRKRPCQEADSPIHLKKEKVIEIPYGTDLDNDDEDLDAMLSSFRNVPAD